MNNLSQTQALGQALGVSLAGGSLIALEGDLGAGKTTLTQSIARGLLIPPSIRVQSPTYTLLKTHLGGRLTLHHMDFYRLSHVDELIELGFEDLLSPTTLTVVEWADRFPEALPVETLHLKLTWLDPDARRLEVAVGGEEPGGSNNAVVAKSIENLRGILDGLDLDREDGNHG